MSVTSPTPHAIGDTPVRTAAQDRVARRLILAAGALCFVLLAWGHLGLGALLFPPAQTAAQQVVTSGPLNISMALDSGQLKAAGTNALTFTITDHAGHAIKDATITAHPIMRTMAMDAPSVSATPDGSGHYIARPKFAMAGDWRLDLTITRPGQQPRTVSFNVTVRW
ncbi:MAG TPA: FixH family protein [Ktedonobacterales bacterium]